MKKSSFIVTLLSYKQIQQSIDNFVDWETRYSEKLLSSWMDYTKNVLFIPYMEYCTQFYNGNLIGVQRKSYFKIYK